MASTQSHPEGSAPHPQPTPAAAPPVPSSTQVAAPATTEEAPPVALGLQQEQVIALLRHLPGVFRVAQGDLKDSAAAEALSNLSQSAFGHNTGQMPVFQYHPPMSEPGPSTHPHGPPNLGQPPLTSGPNVPNGSANMTSGRPGEGESSTQTTETQQSQAESSTQANSSSPDDKPKSSGGRRSGRSATMTNDEWARQRKDNHKEVERRRRGNINEGINELGRIVPNGSGEKAKGAILSRAVSYIHHLKENEARNIEKWTLEKLLMDQAMGDLQGQLEELRRLWDDERNARQRAEAELALLKGIPTPAVPPIPPVVQAPPPLPVVGPTTAAVPSVDPTAQEPPAPEAAKTSPKRTLEEVNNSAAEDLQYPETDADRAKRQRVE